MPTYPSRDFIAAIVLAKEVLQLDGAATSEAFDSPEPWSLGEREDDDLGNDMSVLDAKGERVAGFDLEKDAALTVRYRTTAPQLATFIQTLELVLKEWAVAHEAIARGYETDEELHRFWSASSALAAAVGSVKS